MAPRTLNLVAALVAVVALALPALGQNSPQQIDGATLVSSDPVESSQYLGTTYKSETDGFRLTPPAGSRIVQRQGIDLVSFIVDSKRSGGSLQRLTFTDAPGDKGDPPMTMGELLAKIKKELPKTFKAVEVLQERQVKGMFGDKPTVRFDVRMQAELGAVNGLLGGDHRMGGGAQAARGRAPAGPDVTVGIMRQQLIVQMQSNKEGKGIQFIFLTFYSPQDDREAATKTFEAMLAEFTLYDPKTLFDRRAKAVTAGKEWLQKNDATEFIKKISNQPQYFLQQVENKTVGFIALTEATKVRANNGTMVDVERAGRKGALMTVKFGAFADNRVTYGRIEEFWAVSKGPKGEALGQYSEWDIITKSQIKEPLPPNVKPAPGQPAYTLHTPWMQETGNISQDSPAQRPRIIVTFGGSEKQKLPPAINRVLPEGNPPAPLPKVLEYTWTRFVDVTQPSEMSFVTYDSRNNKLATRNLIVMGKQETIKVNGKSMQAYRCLDEIDPNSTTLWVNKEGQIQLMKTSDQSVFQPTTLEVINKTWPNRPSE